MQLSGLITGMMTGLLLSSGLAMATSYKLDPTHMEVGFNVTHLMISKVKGRFTKVDGAFDFDDKKNEVKGVDVKIEASSINTDNQKRDEHLSGPDFFDVKKFPSLTFKGDKIEKSKDGKPTKVMGTLTMHGVSKPVVLDVEYKGAITDSWGNDRVGFSASTKINRKDFGLSWNQNLDKGGVAVSDDVNITIEGEAIKEKLAKK